MKSAGQKTSPQLLARAIRKLRHRYRERLDRCQRKLSPAAVHGLRIATRRLLAVSDLLELQAAHKPTHKLRRALKERLDAFDDLRDNQVQQKFLAEFVVTAPEVKAIERWLRRRERKLIQHLGSDLKALRPGRIERVLKRTERELVQRSERETENLPPKVSRALRDSFTKVINLHRGVHADRARTIHRLRIAFKHYRYLCELARPLWPQLAEVDLKAMHRLQTLLGEVQDCEVMLAGVRTAVRKEVLAPAAARRMQRAVVRRRAQRIKIALEKLKWLRNFAPSP